MIKTADTIILDAGPLIHLDELGCLDLLTDFASILVPEQVWYEVNKHQPSALGHQSIILKKTVVAIDTSALFQSLTLTFLLDVGEQAALSLMAIHPHAIFLTDDSAARLAAQALNYQAHGTVGILVRSIRRKQRTRMEVLAILQSIPTRSTLHVQHRFLQKIINDVIQSS